MTLRLEHIVPPDSPLARFDPRWKLAALTLAVFAIASLRTLPPAVAAFGLALFLAGTGRLSRRWVRARLLLAGFVLLPFLLILPFTVDRGSTLLEWGALRATDAGLVAAGVLILKTLAIVTLALVLLGTSALHTTLAAARCLYVPELFVQLALMSYRYTFVIAEEFDRIRTALRVRGFRNRADRHSWRTVGQVTGTLLVRGMERAERVGQAMRCRGFDGRFRTLTDFQTKGLDVLMFVSIVAAAGGLVAWDIWG